MHTKKIALGMSGGVDSSLCATLLKEQGYDVTGVFLECWRAPGCRVEEDRKDALAVALKIGIPFQVLDFKKEYKEKVVEYFFAEYKVGRTPNPDVMCNRDIKFGMFYRWAMEHGFDAVATGHYARIKGESRSSRSPRLLRGVDAKKDQSYFLYLLEENQLSHIIFPIGHLRKTEVRDLAAQRHLPVANKPDSQGICFIGDINVHNFLKERLGEKPGEVVNMRGEVIGEHKGLWFYTIGQRHGFMLKGKIRAHHDEWKHVIQPFYVVAKDAKHNRLIVGFGEETLSNTFEILHMHWIHPEDEKRFAVGNTENILIRIRHGGELISAHLEKSDDTMIVTLAKKTQGIAEGQSAVVYDKEVCLGGGVIC
ncbi:MAG TPA: tRNA 2-thiouridine(34) synthase MnmA [Candidatus Pacebacteria bacterium]|nr:MAG: tRNA-specific 2-thiouridylase MnmA [Microgenomates group bacterium GW2011_GWB1_45_17]KKU23085.1 MAG: tRNA-specific 2-thiouridylase MnmA [Microgenomates group bacterium GW2011_GWA1_46_15]KKU23748.1 MAG: tRNA-specific 2-thiouridylase MnmA, tRNA-specific 2-thiouridylase [Microgenomates group bacterium GW2011_GWC1_46_15]HAV15022.1 tRNA 2-thiouridine(34) synthase MnmA [Candidatus Paceibacterota bacterium]HCR11721.1 tRNA 2-thiouridine(34) synthase MnmA [Candidatus Paceibacterota bacterium]